MAKNILILSTSLRAGSNSEALANAFADGARTQTAASSASVSRTRPMRNTSPARASSTR